MTTDMDRARATLRVLSETCSAAIETLQNPISSASQASSNSSPSCAVLRKDYLSLLTLVYTSTTKVALTLHAEEPAYSAALSPLRDLGTNLTALTTCTTLFDAYGATLAEEVRLFTREVSEAVRAFALAFLDDAGQDYLVRTGAVHDLVDKAKRDLSADNRVAVRKRWTADRAMLDDTLEEIASMLEDDMDGDDEDFGDNEWDELGLGSSKKMTEAEIERTKKIQPLMRMTTLLHKRVQLDVLSQVSPKGTLPDPASLDALPSFSHELLLASEEVTAALYAPQNPSNLATVVFSLAESARRLQSALVDRALLPPVRDQSIEGVTEGLAKVTLKPEESKGSMKKERDVRKWFDTCFEQIDKLSKNIGDVLLEQSNGS